MNKPGSCTTIRRQEIDWQVLTGYGHIITDELVTKMRRISDCPACRIIRENKVRTTMILPHPSQGTPLFAKRYTSRGWRDVLKYCFVPSKAFSEWKIMHAFLESGISAARPLAYGEKRRGRLLLESYLLTEAIIPSVTLREYYQKTLHLHHAPDGERKKRTLIRKVAALVSSIHAAGFFYRDLHAENILVVRGDGVSPDLYPVDFHRAWHLGWLPDFMRIRDLAQLKNSLAASPADQLRFLKAYALDGPCSFTPLKPVARRIAQKAEVLWQVHLTSRTKRCLVSSTAFEVKKNAARSLYCHKAYPQDLLSQVLSSYDSPARGEQITLLKETPKEVVSCATVTRGGEQRRVLIKEGRFLRPLDRIRYSFFKTRALRCWIAARGLKVRGVPTPEAIACVEERSCWLPRRTLLLTEFVDQAYELNDYVLKRFGETVSPGDEQTKNRFIAACALQLRDLHDKGVYHADLKSNNILVREHPPFRWEFYFIDLDRVAFRRQLSFEQRSTNLAQLNASIASCITVSDRFHFFRTYARGTGLVKQGKRYFQRIMAIGSRKNTGPYGVSFSPSLKQSTR